MPGPSLRLALIATALAAAAPAFAATPAFPNAARAGPPKFDEADPLAQAVADPGRSDRNTARDAWRHPAESLMFWGVRPGDTIVELSPGGGYWAEILVPFAKATGGRYVAAMAPAALSEEARRERTGMESRFGIQAVDLGKTSGPLAAPGSVDFVLTARNVHNWIWGGMLDKVLADAFTALRPGGVLAVEEHRADPRPMLKDASDGYVSEAAVIDAAEKAGFRLDAKSEINANPKDSKDHPFGVWTLPPVLQSAPRGSAPDPKFDKARYQAIGESDRMTLRFRKPG